MNKIIVKQFSLIILLILFVFANLHFALATDDGANLEFINRPLALKEFSRPASLSNWGKLYVNGTTSNLSFVEDNGTHYDLLANTAAGSDTQFQYNNGGLLAGSPALTYLKASTKIALSTSSTLQVNGDLNIKDTNIQLIGGNTTFSSSGNISLSPANNSDLNLNISGTADLIIGTTKFTMNDSGQMGVNTINPSETLTINGKVALKETSRPSSLSNWGKLYVNGTTSNLCFVEDNGTHYDLLSLSSGSSNPAGNDGSVQFKDGSSFAADANNFHYDKVVNGLGLKTNNPLVTLHVNGAYAVAPNQALYEISGSTVGIDTCSSCPNLLRDKSTIFIYGSPFWPTGCGGTCVDMLFNPPIGNGSVQGQIVRLVRINRTLDVLLHTRTNRLRLAGNGDYIMGKNDTLTLMWVNGSTGWVELYRSDN